MRALVRDNDLLILFSENDSEAKTLMKFGQLRPEIVGRTPPSDKPNYTVTREGKVIEAGFRGELQIRFSKETEGKRYGI